MRECNDPTCGCKGPAFIEPMEALRFLSARMKQAGIADGVAASYARDIDAILATLPASTPPGDACVRHACKRVRMEMRAEIERLRGLLREARDIVQADAHSMREAESVDGDGIVADPDALYFIEPLESLVERIDAALAGAVTQGEG